MPNERRMPNSGNLGGGNRGGGGPQNQGTNKGNKSGSGGAKAGPPGGLNRGNPGKPGYDGKPGGSGGPKKKSTSIMRQSTWDRLTGREKASQYGTMSYKKYKADMEAMKAKSNRPQRGGGEGRGKGGGPDR